MPPPSDLMRRAAYIKSIIVSLGLSGRADPPNDTSSRNLKQRTIGRGAFEVSVCSEVSHRTVVWYPSATVGPESDVERTIERLLVFSVALYERLVTRIIMGEIHDLEHKRLPNFGKVDELDLQKLVRCLRFARAHAIDLKVSG